MAFDEHGQADSVERRVEVLHARPPAAHGAGGLHHRGHHPRPEHLRDRDRHRGARGLRASPSSRPPGASRRRCPACGSAAACPTCSFAFRGNDRVREAIHAVFLYHAIRAGLDMAIVNAGVIPQYDDIDPELLERVEDVVLNRRPDATDRLLEIAPRYAGGAAVTRDRRRPLVARAAGQRAPDPRAGRGHRRVHRRGHRGGPAAGGAAARRHRGAADGRHERRRRPVRGRADVPAPGGQERPGDEEGRRGADPVPGGGAVGGRERAAAGRHDRDGHGQGRRPRHRQEHRGGRAGLQRLRGDRPRGHGAGRPGSWRRRARSARTSSGCPG